MLRETSRLFLASVTYVSHCILRSIFTRWPNVFLVVTWTSWLVRLNSQRWSCNYGRDRWKCKQLHRVLHKNALETACSTLVFWIWSAIIVCVLCTRHAIIFCLSSLWRFASLFFFLASGVYLSRPFLKKIWSTITSVRYSLLRFLQSNILWCNVWLCRFVKLKWLSPKQLETSCKTFCRI